VLGGEVGEAGAKHFLEEGGGERFVDGELNGAFRDGVGFQLGLEFLNDGSGGEEGAMVSEGSEPDEDVCVLESRDAVADDFRGFTGKSGAKGSADFPEGRALGFRDGGEVGVDGCERLLAFCGGLALGSGFRGTHAENGS